MDEQRPRHAVYWLRMCREAVRCEEAFRRAVEDPGYMEVGVEDFLEEEGFSPEFLHHCLAPALSLMYRAWQLKLPVRLVAYAFVNGVLSFGDPRRLSGFLTVHGGSQEYIARISAGFRDRVRLGVPVLAVSRAADRVLVRDAVGEETYDHVVIAIPATAALSILADPSDDEIALLGSVKYEPATVVLHCRSDLMPAPELRSSVAYFKRTTSTKELPMHSYRMRDLQDWLEDDLFVSIDRAGQPAQRQSRVAHGARHPKKMVMRAAAPASE